MIGIVLVTILTALIVMLVMKIRRPSDPQRPISLSQPLHQDEKVLDNRPLSSGGLLSVRVKEQSSGCSSINGGSPGGGTANGGGSGSGLNGGSGGVGDPVNGAIIGDTPEDNDPDVIPHKAGKFAYSICMHMPVIGYFLSSIYYHILGI